MARFVAEPRCCCAAAAPDTENWNGDARGARLGNDSLRRGTLRTVWRTDLGLDAVRALRADAHRSPPSSCPSPALSRSTPDGKADGGATQYGSPASTPGGRPGATRSPRRLSICAAVRRSGCTSGPATTARPLRRSSTASSSSRATPGDVERRGHDHRDGPNWYPMRVELPQAAGRPGARVRFISEHFTWCSTPSASRRTPARRSTSLRRARRRSLRKPGAEQSGRHLLGPPRPALPASRSTASRVSGCTRPRPRADQRICLDLTLGGGARRVVNGAYIIVVDVDGHRYRPGSSSRGRHRERRWSGRRPGRSLPRARDARRQGRACFSTAC